ncbi:Antirestriction protein [Raoultella terrigena]|uniref:Antirestriction protein n=1 Tax=Raoultella terrigena TaxID=577 RepID=A0A4U9DDM7_RAOTE|nr:Antirestriction protein [Raoultella terrigena]
MQLKTRAVLNVEESDRLSFLPYMFGNDFMIAELQVYALAKKLMPEYEGCFWYFIRLPGRRWLHDAGLWASTSGSHGKLVRSYRQCDAAGIILTSMAVNRRLAAWHDCNNPALTHLYMLRDAQLWNHITFHPECNAIYAALE